MTDTALHLSIDVPRIQHSAAGRMVADKKVTCVVSMTTADQAVAEAGPRRAGA